MIVDFINTATKSQYKKKTVIFQTISGIQVWMTHFIRDLDKYIKRIVEEIIRGPDNLIKQLKELGIF